MINVTVSLNRKFKREKIKESVVLPTLAAHELTGMNKKQKMDETRKVHRLPPLLYQKVEHH